jgi:predicted Zn-dependent peptidase
VAKTKQHRVNKEPMKRRKEMKHMKTVRINENISLNLIGMDKLKTTTVGVYIHRPLNREEVSFNTVLPLVLKNSSVLCPGRDATAKYLENLYGAALGSAVMKRGEDHVIYFDAETIADCYAPNNEKLVSELLRLVMSVLFDTDAAKKGAFDEKLVEQEKKNTADAIDAFVNDKRRYALWRCQQETARGTAFEILSMGDKEGLEKINAKNLYHHYKSIITSSVIDIYICGKADIDKVEKTIREYTDNLSFSAAQVPRTDIIERNENDINTVKEEMDVTQGKLSIGFLTGIKPEDPDSCALTVFNSLFGAGAHSKLFNNVREKLSLAYYASSQLERFKGMLTVNAGVEFENFQKAYDETLVQLEEIKKGNISEHEFNSSISAVINTCRSYYDDQRALASYYLTEKISGRDLSLEDYIENLQKVTVEEVAAVAKKIKLDTVYFLKGREGE